MPNSFPCSLCSYLNKSGSGTSQVTNLTKVWRENAECDERATFHCNRDKEKWFPKREEYRKKLEEQSKTYVTELQEMVL